MNDIETQKAIQKLNDRLKKLENESIITTKTMDPSSYAFLSDFNALPYYTTAPTWTPKKNGIQAVVKTGGLYYLYIYVDGGWKRVQIA